MVSGCLAAADSIEPSGQADGAAEVAGCPVEVAAQLAVEAGDVFVAGAGGDLLDAQLALLKQTRRAVHAPELQVAIERDAGFLEHESTQVRAGHAEVARHVVQPA